MISGCRHAAYPGHAHRLDLSSPPLVKALGLSRYLEIRTIRFALEGLAAEQAAAHASAGEIERLAEIQRRFEAARNSRDAALANRLNRDFHFGLSLMRDGQSHWPDRSLWVAMGPILKV
ncbi:FCD domain-containing protein [Rhodoligotrophos ferricapiens]|uniref:FCD domain-containing protein n=1 Tax=Rhodoligotrophos ferricapiens TaxID=3069264 RepID=UPI00315DFF95